MNRFEQPLLTYLERAAAEAGTGTAISRDTRLLESGLLDSIGIVGLIQFIESEFAIQIPDADVGLELLETPASIAGYLAARHG